MANNKSILVKGYNNFVGVGSDRITLIDCVNCTVEPTTSGLTAINCTDIDFTAASGNNTYVNGGVVQGHRWKNATSSAPSLVGGDYDLYFIDTSTGDVNILLDTRFLNNKWVTFKIIDATNDVVFTALYGTGSEQFEFNAMPYTFTPVLGDSLTVAFNGSNFYII